MVVEIGAGSGVLTEARAGRVVAVEYDPGLAGRARDRLARLGNVRVVTGDALALPAPRRPFRVMANPPFGSIAAILRRPLGDPPSGRRRGWGRPCWWPAAGSRRWSRGPATAAHLPAAAASSASPWTPARPTWTPPNGPACSRCSSAVGLGSGDASP
jgi:23S rRNA (adenine-N6)-dimethyltransferase